LFLIFSKEFHNRLSPYECLGLLDGMGRIYEEKRPKGPAEGFYSNLSIPHDLNINGSMDVIGLWMIIYKTRGKGKSYLKK